MARYASGVYQILTSLVHAITSRSSSEQNDARQVEGFFEVDQVQGCERAIRQCIQETSIIAS